MPEPTDVAVVPVHKVKIRFLGEPEVELDDAAVVANDFVEGAERRGVGDLTEHKSTLNRSH